ncbi:hypothetical protein BpHYR1_051959 [Brachionus plicatilis]|uniref:Uncharacterized protein n=1 Tax=Brachionus plicatilis TaxID=10195 RepID=A0A3M7SG01_BRAPC|nr:hypothetical protein BpHYR1_051959 [Brachionus plicatilis]
MSNLSFQNVYKYSFVMSLIKTENKRINLFLKPISISNKDWFIKISITIKSLLKQLKFIKILAKKTLSAYFLIF